MKRKLYKNSGFTILGALLFFALIAFIIQVAVLVYDYIRERTDNNWLIAILILFVIFILAGICTLIDYFRRRIMVRRPVERILRATEMIANGDFGTRIEISHTADRYDEYDLIAENLNLMAEELGKGKIVSDDFISNVSHELKSPLTVIRTYGAALADESLDAETRKKYSRVLLSASQRLSDLVSNVLKLNKLEHGDMRANYEEVNLTEMISSAVLEFETQIEEKELKVECDLDDVTLVSAPTYLEIVWTNLISNAVKFTDPGGSIFVSLKTVDDNVVAEIRDTGCGMSREVGERIFEKFYQGDTSHSSEGNGLGLPMVKKVIEKLGGEISVNSTPGVGTTFIITLRS